MTVKMSQRQKVVLGALRGWERREGCGATAADLAGQATYGGSLTPAQVSTALRALAAKGVVEASGVSAFRGGTAYRVTDAGRSA